MRLSSPVVPGVEEAEQVGRAARFSRILAFIVAVVVSSACGQAASQEPGETPPGDPPVFEIASPPVTPPPTSTPTATEAPVLTLVAVGDIMLARSVGQRVVSDGPEAVFEEPVAAILRDADIAAGNLESPVSERGEPQVKGYAFRAPPAAAGALEAAGFDVLSLANNHALDYGREALQDTVQLLRDRSEAAVGVGPDLATARSAMVLERGGLRIAVVGLVDAPEEGAGFSRRTWEAGPDGWGVAWADEESVTASVEAAARSADVVVAMLHFGFEYHSVPSARQRALARRAIDAGATLVVGSHPHVLQELEVYGEGLIAYSLGNFVFDGFDGSANDSAILRVDLTREGIRGWELLPVTIDDGGLPHLKE